MSRHPVIEILADASSNEYEKILNNNLEQSDEITGRIFKK